MKEFLEKKEFFEKPYGGSKDDFLVVTDPKLADMYFNRVTDFGDWGDVQNYGYGDIDELPGDEFMRSRLKYVGDALISKEKDFHNANCAAVNLQDNMISDFCNLFDLCCMEMKPSPVWMAIKYAYLHSGWPCGWDGEFPTGRMVVFSNEINLVR
ncbi:hypothetical protein ACIGHN_26910 [Acidovorax sp. NPDC077693]|uniref:hypothetical protein n=1 Tax=unclassified Acidovorax TaxID=2684926 RepID=UPI0037CA9161